MAAREVVHAPELTGRAWLNTTQPLSLRDLAGKVVLLDFWTFCCINCLHVLDELRALEDRFGDDLVVIGVHSPKFPHEQDPAALARAVSRYGVTHPVLDDPDRTTWDRYGVRSWPTMVLIDARGYIVGSVSGEGAGPALERAIEQTLADAEITLQRRRGPLGLTISPPAPTTPLAFPGKLALDPATGTLAVADTGHNRIVVTSPEGGVLAVVGSGERGLRDGPHDTAEFAEPQGVCFHGGALYVADTANHALRRIDLATYAVETVAGTGAQARGATVGAGGSGGPAMTTPLNSPWDLASSGPVLVVAMAGAHQLWVFDPERSQVGVLAGTGHENLVDGPARNAALAQPSGVDIDRGGRVWFVDSETSSLRAVTMREDHMEIVTLVGTGLFAWGDDDGPTAHASLQHPLGVTCLEDGRILVCDTYNSRLRVVDPVLDLVTTVPIADGTLDEPSAAAVLRDGLVLVADTNHHRLLTVELNLGAVEAFSITGLTAPQALLGIAEFDHVALAPGGTVKLILVPRLDRNEKLDPSGGSPLRIEVAGGPSADGLGPRLTLDVIPVGTELVVETLVVSCGEGHGAVCRSDRRRAMIPVTIEEGAPGKVEVTL